MPKRVMLVIGNCDRQNYESIQESVLEKLNRAEETSLLFCEAETLATEGELVETINRLVAGLDPGIAAAPTHVEVVVVFEGGKDDIERLAGIQRELENTKDRIGIWQFNYHLIWLAQEFPRLQYTYSELLQALIKNRLGFQWIYFLSDRHSDLSHGKEVRINGAALLLNTLQSDSAKYISPGFYTVGVGKNQITATEMRSYAKHRAVEALQNQAIRWTQFNTIEEVSSAAFDSEAIHDEDELFLWLQTQMNERMISNFAFVKGDTYTCTKPQPLASLDFSDVLRQWTENMRDYLTRIPFVEKAEDFFREGGRFREMADRIEKRFFSITAPEIKAGFLASGEQKDVIRELNVFRSMNQEQIRKGWTAFRKQWEGVAVRVQEEAEKQRQRRDEILLRFIRDDQFLQICEEIAGSTTKQITQQLAKLEITRERFLAFSGDREFTEETADKMMNWIAETACKNISQYNMILDLTRKDPGALISQVFKPVISKSGVYLACLSKEKPKEANYTFLFMPESLYREHSALTGVYVVPVETEEYQNVEALSFAKLGDANTEEGAGKLTAFQGVAAPVSRSSRIEAYTPAEAKETRGEQKESDPEDLQDPSEENNPWNIAVQSMGTAYRATFVWSGSVDLLTVRMDYEDGYSQSIPLKRSDFLAQGDVDITELVNYGSNRISLVSGGKTLSNTAFTGRRHLIEMEINESDFKLDQNNILQKAILKVTAVDGDSKSQLSHSVCNGMRLLLDHKDQLPMPLPWDKHKQQGWTIILENGKSYIPILADEYSSSYEIHVV